MQRTIERSPPDECALTGNPDAAQARSRRIGAVRVSEIIKDKGSKVISVSPADSVERVSRVLRDARIGAVLVLDEDGRMAGIISERDIVNGVADRGADVLAEPASNLMTRDVRTCTPDSSVDQLMSQMIDGHIRHLPVVEQGGLAGIVSVSDVVKQGLAEAHAVRDTLQRYIHDVSVRAIDYD